MHKEWRKLSKRTQWYLEIPLLFPRDDKLFFKNINGNFGFMNYDDALNRRYAIVMPYGDTMVLFDSLTDLLNAGWVLD